MVLRVSGLAKKQASHDKDWQLIGKKREGGIREDAGEKQAQG